MTPPSDSIEAQEATLRDLFGLDYGLIADEPARQALIALADRAREAERERDELREAVIKYEKRLGIPRFASLAPSDSEPRFPAKPRPTPTPEQIAEQTKQIEAVLAPPSDSIEALVEKIGSCMAILQPSRQLDQEAREALTALADRAREAERETADALVAAEAGVKALREALLRIEVLLDSPRAAEPFVRGQVLGEVQRALGVT